MTALQAIGRAAIRQTLPADLEVIVIGEQVAWYGVTIGLTESVPVPEDRA